MRKLVIGITMGDPAGIGPEVTIKALRSKQVRRLADYVIIGNSEVFSETARICRIKFNPGLLQRRLNHARDCKISLLNVGKLANLVFGQANYSYGLLTLDCINTALRLLKEQTIDALVTAPVNKSTICQTGCLFIGHTEYLAQASNTNNFAMMLIGGPLKVVLVTRHLPLKSVANMITKDNIYQALRLTAQYLKKYFAIKHPRIGVCGLNPHSGDKGFLGVEEAAVIHPAIIRARRLADIVGPISADTIFYAAMQGKFDAVCAMYHDQGLIPLKTFAFHTGVNLTLGLPFIRTSPDHGTAYDIAGKNQANPSSMIEAIKLVAQISSRIKKGA